MAAPPTRASRTKQGSLSLRFAPAEPFLDSDPRPGHQGTPSACRVIFCRLDTRRRGKLTGAAAHPPRVGQCLHLKEKELEKAQKDKEREEKERLKKEKEEQKDKERAEKQRLKKEKELEKDKERAEKERLKKEKELEKEDRAQAQEKKVWLGLAPAHLAHFVASFAKKQLLPLGRPYADPGQEAQTSYV